MAKKRAMQVVANPENSEAMLPDDFNPQRIAVKKAELRSMEDRSIAEQVADSNVYYRNWEFPGAKQAFPYHVRMRYCEKMFPYSKPLPLVVDQPENHIEEAECLKRLPHVLAAGYRYLILDKSATVEEARSAIKMPKV